MKYCDAVGQVRFTMFALFVGEIQGLHQSDTSYLF